MLLHKPIPFKYPKVGQQMTKYALPGQTACKRDFDIYDKNVFWAVQSQQSQL